MTDTINITLEEYKELIDARDFLACLEGAGVDNWTGYDEAVDMMENTDG